jgi:hypothetical protein
MASRLLMMLRLRSNTRAIVWWNHCKASHDAVKSVISGETSEGWRSPTVDPELGKPVRAPFSYYLKQSRRKRPADR